MTERRSAALRCEKPPRYRRPPRPSKLDPYRDEIDRLLRGDPRLPGKRLRELLEELGYEGGKTILDDYLREVRDGTQNDYSLDPRLAGRRVEVRVSQREVTAVALDTGALAARHRRSFARHRTLTAPEHERLLTKLRGERRSEPEVEQRLPRSGTISKR